MPIIRQSRLHTPGEYTREATDALACSISHRTIPLKVATGVVTSTLAAFTETEVMPLMSTEVAVTLIDAPLEICTVTVPVPVSSSVPWCPFGVLTVTLGDEPSSNSRRLPDRVFRMRRLLARVARVGSGAVPFQVQPTM